MELIKIIILSVLIICVLAAILIFSMKIKKESHASIYSGQYLDIFKKIYEESKDVKYTLTRIKCNISPESKEYQAIDSALLYLQESIARDYFTAFSMIENVFHSKEIEEVHKMCMHDIVQRRQYLITTNQESF